MSDIQYLEIQKLEAECGQLKARVAEDNEVCLCGCSTEEHENYGEDGESCGNDAHQCVRTCIAIRDMYAEKDRQIQRARASIAEHFEGMHQSSVIWSNSPYDKGFCAGLTTALAAFDEATK